MHGSCRHLANTLFPLLIGVRISGKVVTEPIVRKSRSAHAKRVNQHAAAASLLEAQAAWDLKTDDGPVHILCVLVGEHEKGTPSSIM